MIHYRGYAYFKDKADFLRNTNQEDDRFYFSGGYIKAMPQNFPVTFQFEDPWDNHSCGIWTESDEELLIARLKDSIVELSDAIIYIKKS